MEPNMALDQFTHQTVERAATRRHQLEHIRRFGLLLQGLLNRVDLPANASDSVDQLVLVSSQVSHWFIDNMQMGPDANVIPIPVPLSWMTEQPRSLSRRDEP